LPVISPPHDESGDETIEYSDVDIPNGQKADVVRQFFVEDCITIIREGKAFVIDEIIFDEVALPSVIQPQHIEE